MSTDDLEREKQKNEIQKAILLLHNNGYRVLKPLPPNQDGALHWYRFIMDERALQKCVFCGAYEEELYKLASSKEEALDFESVAPLCSFCSGIESLFPMKKPTVITIILKGES